jgi:hypothetical protein
MTKRRKNDITLHCRVDSYTLKKIDIARLADDEEKLTRSAWLKAAIEDRLDVYIIGNGHFPEDEDE